jgi:hypothetical protein
VQAASVVELDEERPLGDDDLRREHGDGAGRARELDEELGVRSVLGCATISVRNGIELAGVLDEACHATYVCRPFGSAGDRRRECPGNRRRCRVDRQIDHPVFVLIGVHALSRPK